MAKMANHARRPSTPHVKSRVHVAGYGRLASPDAGADLGEDVGTDVASIQVAGAVVVVALAAAIQNGNGMLHGHAIRWLTVAVAAAVLGPIWPRQAGWQRVCRLALPFVLCFGFAYAFSMWPFVRPALYAQMQGQTPQQWAMYTTCLGCAAVLAGLSLNPPVWANRVLLPALLVVYACLGAWLLALSSAPKTDVVTLHKEALSALVHGRNPFAVTFPNIFPDISHYPPGLVEDGRVLFGYDYPPLNLLLALPGYLFGDYRWSLLGANALSATMLATLRPHRATPAPWGMAMAALFLLTPRALLILENGWTEPFTVLLFMAVLHASMHRPAWVPYALGLLFASKQYVVLLGAAAWQLPAVRQAVRQPQLAWAFGARAVATAALCTIPFVLWSPAAFWHSVVMVPLNHPFRDDALSFLAWYRQSYGTLWPTGTGFVAAAAASVLCVLRLRPSPAGFAYSFGAIFLLFVAFNRQAFCNYYFLALAAFCAAVVVTADAPRPAPRPQGWRQPAGVP